MNQETTTTPQRTFHVERRSDGLRTVTIDRPDKSVNTLSQRVLDELDELLTDLETETDLRGVMFRSGKRDTFIAGADVEEMKHVTGADDARRFSERGQHLFARLERLRAPTVALISGSCLGGGLEFALACTFRLADDGRKTLMGLPEVKLGLVPGWGGTVRLPRQVGLLRAIRMVTTGSLLNGPQAKSAALIDDVVVSEALEAAGQELLTRGRPRKYRSSWRDWLLGRRPMSEWLFRKATRMVLAESHGHYPAPLKALDVIRRGWNGSAEAGFEAECEAISALAEHPVTAELIRLFFLREGAKDWAQQAFECEATPKIYGCGLLGAGTMGAGLAKIMAERGIEVRLKDVTTDRLAEGLREAKRLFDSDVRRKRASDREAEQAYDRISPTTDFTGFRNTEVVIEAVVEDLDVKRQVFRDLEVVSGPKTVLATNTSSLRVADIAAAVKHPERVVGVHFFNPPHKMPLVEIVRTNQSSPEAMAVALALARKLGKTPVVVRDCAGFLVNRLLTPYLNEAGHLLTEVDRPLDIDRAAVDFGFPMGPLALTDLVGAGVSFKVGAQMHAAYGERMEPAPAWQRL